jgi:hypothetical protein
MIKQLKKWRQQNRDRKFQNGYQQVYMAHRRGELTPALIDDLVGTRTIPPFEKGVFVALSELEGNLLASPECNQKGEPVGVTFTINPTVH